MGMGYQGFAKFYKTSPSTDPLIVLTTGASVNLVLEPIYSSAVLGHGWYNAATSSHYADNALRYEGNIDFELQGSTDIWNLMGDWVVNERAYSRSMDISPDGARVYQYRNSGGNTAYNKEGCWNTSFGMSTSEGSFVGVSAGVLALTRNEYDAGGGTGTAYSDYSYINQKTGVNAADCNTIAASNPLNPSANNVDPIPFWRTNANMYLGTYSSPFSGGSAFQTDVETVEWGVDITQNHVLLYTCNGDREPTALLQGPMDVSGNVVLYHEDGVYDPILGNGTGAQGGASSNENPYSVAENTWFRIEIERGTLGKVFIEIPAAVIESDDYSIQGQDSVTNRGFSIKGLGGRCSGTNTLPPCILSSAVAGAGDGTYVTP